MGIKDQLSRHKDKVILIGFATGLLFIMDLLPKTISTLGDKTTWAYAGIILLGGYTFYEFYMGKGGGSHINLQRTVHPRNLSDPDAQNRLRQQMGGYTQPKPAVVMPQPGTHQPIQKPSQGVFDTFKRD